MLVRNTAFISLIYTHDGDPIAYAHSYSRGVPDSTGWMKAFVYTTASSISASNVTWQKSTNGGESYADAATTGHYGVTYSSSAYKSGSSTIYQADTVLTITNLEDADYGLYRIKATGTDGTVYSQWSFDFSNPS